MLTGSCLAPEVFQNRLIHALEGLTGIKAIGDDVLIAGEGNKLLQARQRHECKRISFFTRCRKKNRNSKDYCSLIHWSVIDLKRPGKTQKK